MREKISSRNCTVLQVRKRPFEQFLAATASLFLAMQYLLYNTVSFISYSTNKKEWMLTRRELILFLHCSFKY
jgi:hypothetical protein